MLLSVDSSSKTFAQRRRERYKSKNDDGQKSARRLGSNERLLSQIPRGGTKGKPKRDVPPKSIKEKLF